MTKSLRFESRADSRKETAYKNRETECDRSHTFVKEMERVKHSEMDVTKVV